MSVWEDIKERLRLEEVIAEYVPVQAAGSNYRCVCPFHREKTPSLMISPEKQIWHCFGCGAGGDVFRFVMDIENLSKQEVLQKLAKRSGVQLPSMTSQKTISSAPDSPSVNTDSQNSRLVQGYQLLAWTARVYHLVLLKILQDRQHPVTLYCLDRGLNMDLIRRFQIGYAPGRQFLLTLANKHSLDQDLLLDVGVLKSRDLAKPTDKFVDRLMIPVVDRQSRVVGFTGRVLQETPDRPKYLNSPQTQWFHKSQLWFGWPLAQSEIRHQATAIVVEGNMDVIACHKAGLQHVLASQGTSFTTEQLKRLKMLTRKVWLAFDNDQAGKLAADKFYKQAVQLGLEVWQVQLPETYKDLDEYLKSLSRPPALGADFLGDLKVLPYMQAQILQSRPDLQTSDLTRQKSALQRLVDLLGLQDPIAREQYGRQIADLSKISWSTLSSLVLAESLELPEQTSDTRPEITTGNTILVHFQNLLASYISWEPVQEAPLLEAEALEQVFKILKHLLPQLKDCADLQTYIQDHGSQLKLIYDSNKQPRPWSSILLFIDRQVGQILLNPDLKDAYLQLKQNGLRLQAESAENS